MIQKITNYKLKDLEGVSRGKLVIPEVPGCFYREGSNFFEIGNDVIIIYAMHHRANKTQYLYYSYSSKEDIKAYKQNWTTPKILNVFRNDSPKIRRQMEDGYINIRPWGFSLIAEDKTKSAPDWYNICQFTSTDWDYKTNSGTWKDIGTIYKKQNPLGAVYSPLRVYEHDIRYTFLEERVVGGYKEISIVDAETRKILIKWNAEYNGFVPDYMYKYIDTYIMWLHALYYRMIDGKKTPFWCHLIAESKDLLSGWKIVSDKIKPIGSHPLYLDGEWYFFPENNGTGLHIGEPKYKETVPMEKPIIELVDNQLRITNIDSGVDKYSWQYWDTESPNRYTSWLAPFAETFDIPLNLQVNGFEFWCYGRDSNGKVVTSDSIRFVYKDAVVPDPIIGCMDSKANNYNPDATKDTVPSSCTYGSAPDPDDKEKLQDGIALIEQGLIKIKEVEIDL